MAVRVRANRLAMGLTMKGAQCGPREMTVFEKDRLSQDERMLGLMSYVAAVLRVAEAFRSHGYAAAVKRRGLSSEVEGAPFPAYSAARSADGIGTGGCILQFFQQQASALCSTVLDSVTRSGDDQYGRDVLVLAHACASTTHRAGVEVGDKPSPISARALRCRV